MRKFKSGRGETLTEVLLATMIVLMAAAMLVTLTTSAVNVNNTANEAAENLYRELIAAELRGEEVEDTEFRDGEFSNYEVEKIPGKLKINEKEILVTYYRTEDGALVSFEKDE